MHQPGTVVELPLPDGRSAHGRVCRDATVAFYRDNRRNQSKPPIGCRDFMFVVGVPGDVVATWVAVGQDPFDVDEDDGWPPPQSIADPLNADLSIYHHGAISHGEPAETDGMEPAGFWGQERIVARLLAEMPACRPTQER
jgi:hypothetical protein